MNLALFHGLSKSKEHVDLAKKASMILMYQTQGNINASGIYHRKPKIPKHKVKNRACM